MTTGNLGPFRHASGTVLATLTLLLAACSVQPAPIDTHLDVPVPTEWVHAADSITDAAAPDWWQSFGDDNLTRLITEALERNQNLQAAAARVLASEAQARIAGADLSPQVSADANGSRRRQNFIGLPIPGVDVLSSTTTAVGVNLNVSWEADLWGRLRARKAGAISNLEASHLDYQAARLSLAGQTAKAWFAVLESERQVDVAQRTLESRQTTLERIRRRYKAGLSQALELRFAISDAALAKSLVAQRRQQAQATRRALQLIVYRYPSGTLDELTAASHLPSLPEPVPGGLPADLVARRPDLTAVETRLAAAGWSVTEARRALYPRLTLTGSTGSLSSEVEDLLDSDFSVWSIAGGLLAPLFQGGRLRAAVDISEARQQEALAHYVQSILVAFSEVEGSLTAEDFLSQRDQALRVAVDEANSALALAKSQYASGLVTYLAVLESQRQSLNAESQLVSVQRQRLDARVDLYLALGGDWRPQQPITVAAQEDATR
jgi:NodT family efflux transporter outer membrane factor (OMF) lipoprotein